MYPSHPTHCRATIIKDIKSRLPLWTLVRGRVWLRVIGTRHQRIVGLISSHVYFGCGSIPIVSLEDEQDRLDRVGGVQHGQPSMDTERTALV